MSAAASRRTAPTDQTANRADIAAARPRAAGRLDSGGFRWPRAVSLGDGDDSDACSIVSTDCVWCALDFPVRIDPDGGGRQHIVGTDSNPGAADTYLCTAPDPETAGCLPDLDAARQRLYATPAATPDQHTDGRLSRLARRALRLGRRAGAVADDPNVYTGGEYDGWIE